MSSDKKIMIFADWYRPGYRGGGLTTSCVNFVENMRDHYQIWLFTSDRDFGTHKPYDGLPVDAWTTAQPSFRVYYCSPSRLTWKNIRHQLKAVDPTHIYLISMYSRYFTIYPLLIHRSSNLLSKVILTPNGMLRGSAIQYKSLKKKSFLTLFRYSGFPDRIHFQATDETEREDIKKFFGPSARVALIPFFLPARLSEPVRKTKNPGALQMIFVGRIHLLKNLDFLLRALRTVNADIRLDVVGVLEDPAYWQKCLAIIRSLPANIQVHYFDNVPAEGVRDFVLASHMLVLPTRGENFGYSIIEVLALGKPVLISDQTPWHFTESKRAGWDLPIENPEIFSSVIRKVAGMDQAGYDDLCDHALQFAGDFQESQHLKEKYMELFN